MACSTTLTGIPLDCRESVGGIKALYMMAADSGISFTASAGVVSLTSISVNGTALTSLASLEEYGLARDTANIAEAGTYSNENGTAFYTQTLTAVFNKLTGDKLDKLYQVAKNVKLCVIALDNNDKYWLIGNDQGAFASGHDAQTGTVFGDRNGATLTITGITKEPIVEVTV